MARKEKMKVYHGIPKSVVDEHTILYASFDGNIKPFSSRSNNSYKPTFTGYGVNIKNGEYFEYHDLNFNDVVTVDLLYTYTSQGNVEGNAQYLVRLSQTGKTTFKALRIRKDKHELHFSPYINNSNLGGTKVQNLEEGRTYHIRMVLDGYTSTVYVDGVKKVYTTDTLSCKELDYIGISLTNGGWGATGIYADLHVSNINRGDYFPNLPQDFIDGKAIIKPRMSQQQIKGDPLYSQTTILRVPHSKADGEILYGNYNSVTGLEQNFKKPELFASHTRDWRETSSRIRIKGLNDEIISGVIGNQTALFTALSSPEGNKLYVDNVSKISVGDQFKAWHLPRKVVDSGVYTVANIDIANKLLTLTHSSTAVWTQDAIDSGWTKGVEITPSTSCPTVKTQDGIKVNGTWRGLGTNEAEFTLGENTNIAGKDLYIEYSLNIPHGNSDFHEIPYIEEKAWGENGVEMKPVSELIIIDDFKGKISGSSNECPHKIYHCLMSSLQPVSNIHSNIASGFVEISSQSNIYNIGSLNDNNLYVTGVTQNNTIPQQLFSFNLIEMVERKLGVEIPSSNKVQWLKDNLINTTFNISGYGESPVGYKFHTSVFVVSENRWFSPASHSSNTISKISAGTNKDYTPNCIDNNGFIHYNAYTEASNGTTPSKVHTDYCSLEIILKTNPDFTTLYCENTRSREDKCNPVLIQKETKTVKRYLPSNECFVTECKYSKFKNEGVIPDLDVLVNKHFSIGVSTSHSNKHIRGSKINLNQLPLEKAEHLYSYINEHKYTSLVHSSVFPNNITEIPIVYWRSDNGANIFTLQTTTNNFKTCISDNNAFKGQRGGYKDCNNNIIIYGDIEISNLLSKDMFRLYDVALVIKNNEIMLYVIKSSNGSRFYVYNDAVTLIRLPNRPLIK